MVVPSKAEGGNHLVNISNLKSTNIQKYEGPPWEKILIYLVNSPVLIKIRPAVMGFYIFYYTHGIPFSHDLEFQ